MLPRVFNGFSVCVGTTDGFCPLFLNVTKSRYKDSYSFQSGLTQEDVLGWEIPEEPDLMFAARDAVVRNPENVFLFLKNPCHHGFHFTGIRKGIISIFVEIGFISL